MPVPKSPSRLFLPLLATLIAGALAACNERQVSHASPSPAVPEVSVVTVQAVPMGLTAELPGRITPTRVAEVRPRVSGIIVARSFTQGSNVKAGDVLYRIDPAPFEAELESARASLARAEALAFQTQRQSERLRALAARQAASEAQAEVAIAAERQAAADVAFQQAAVKRAQLNLDYATIRAPIGGRIGPALVTEGALVSHTEATHLATIQQLDPVYADFTQSVGELNRLKRDLANGALKSVAPEAASVRLLLDEEVPYPHAGRLLFSDVSVDPGTGQVTLRGEFPNPEKELLPGMYVRVLIEQAIDVDALAVPAQALQRNNAGGSEVYVINDEGRAVLQPVRTGRAIGDLWVIEDGLKAGNRVVVEGFQKFTSGDLVKPVPWTLPGSDVAWAPPTPAEVTGSAKSAGAAPIQRAAQSR